jgi:hypothetical protein
MWVEVRRDFITVEVHTNHTTGRDPVRKHPGSGGNLCQLADRITGIATLNY